MRSDNEIRADLARLNADFSHGAASPPSAVWTVLGDVEPLLAEVVGLRARLTDCEAELVDAREGRREAIRTGYGNAAAVDAVRALHRPSSMPDELYWEDCKRCQQSDDCEGHEVICCSGCYGRDEYGESAPNPYPCPTARATAEQVTRFDGCRCGVTSDHGPNEFGLLAAAEQPEPTGACPNSAEQCAYYCQCDPPGPFLVAAPDTFIGKAEQQDGEQR